MVPESGASPAPGQPPRECLLWLRSLNLDSRPTPQLLANGFLLAEIFSRYFPRISTSPTNKSRQMHRRSDTSSRSSNDIQPQRLRRRNAAGDATTRTPTLEFPFYSFTNGCGTTAKAENWALLRRFLERQFDLDLSENVIAMVSAGHRGLGWAIVCEVWQLMTGKPHAMVILQELPDPSTLVFSYLDVQLPTSHAGGSHTLSPSPRGGSDSPAYMLPTTSRVVHTIPAQLLARVAHLPHDHVVDKLATRCQESIESAVRLAHMDDTLRGSKARRTQAAGKAAM